MRYRLFVLPLAGLALVLTGTVLFGDLNRNLVYYLTPQEAISKRADFPDGRRFRLGGFVEPGTVTSTAQGITFTVSGGGASVRVEHRGAPTQLFRPGIGVVVEGAWRGDVFVSDTMIIKHGADYRPPTGAAAPTPGAQR